MSTQNVATGVTPVRNDVNPRYGTQIRMPQAQLARVCSPGQSGRLRPSGVALPSALSLLLTQLAGAGTWVGDVDGSVFVTCPANDVESQIAESLPEPPQTHLEPGLRLRTLHAALIKEFAPLRHDAVAALSTFVDTVEPDLTYRIPWQNSLESVAGDTVEAAARHGLLEALERQLERKAMVAHVQAAVAEYQAPVLRDASWKAELNDGRIFTEEELSRMAVSKDPKVRRKGHKARTRTHIKR